MGEFFHFTWGLERKQGPYIWGIITFFFYSKANAPYFPRVGVSIDRCITLRSLFFACRSFSDLEEGKTYQFDNLGVRREYNTKDIILAKPKTGCKAVKTASFKDNVIQPFELLKSLTTTTTPAEILGVKSFTAYHSCCQCKKKIILEKSTVITCNIRGVKQKVKSTTEQCYIDINAAKVTVTLFHDIIKNLLISQGKHGLPINEDNETSLFLKLLTLSSSHKNSAN